MKRTHQRRATARRKTTTKRYKKRSNPTAAAAAPARKRSNWGHKLRSYASKAKARVKATTSKFDFTSVLVEGLALTGGMLASSFVERQVQKFMPDLSPTIRAVAGGVVVAGAAYLVGSKLGKKEVGKGLLLGGVAAAIRSLGEHFAPGAFAGTDPALVNTGTWDAYGQYADSYAPNDHTVMAVGA
jgi:hypothetical protein